MYRTMRPKPSSMSRYPWDVPARRKTAPRLRYSSPLPPHAGLPGSLSMWQAASPTDLHCSDQEQTLMSEPVNVLVVSKGHDYNHDSFMAMFNAMDNVTMTLVEQPAAQVVLQPEHVTPYDVIFFYDMCGIPGAG